MTNGMLLSDWFADAADAGVLVKGTWGMEREAHRMTSGGDLALTGHPAVFGDKLSNPHITTDFAESQLEMITPPMPSVEEAHEALHRIHDEVERGIGDEWLWPLSMPPKLPEEELIPIARYNDTEEGRARELYRISLAQRYGKKMQMISGLHINYSFHGDLLKLAAAKSGRSGDERRQRDELYMAMARNTLRYRWLLVYLFGASPSVDPTYDSVVCGELKMIEQCCPACRPKVGQYEQYATSLRVSRFGYANTAPGAAHVSFNSLEEHIASFHSLLHTVLYKESEFYCSIRLKPKAAKELRYLESLEQNGIEYAELRIMDLNPYERTGISLHQLRFIHVFLLYCLFEQSPPIAEEEWRAMNENHHLVSLFGRKPDLRLHHPAKGQVQLTEWADKLLSGLQHVARRMDLADGSTKYYDAIEEERRKAKDPQLILSAAMTQDMQTRGESLLDFGIRRAELNRYATITGRS